MSSPSLPDSILLVSDVPESSDSVQAEPPLPALKPPSARGGKGRASRPSSPPPAVPGGVSLDAASVTALAQALFALQQGASIPPTRVVAPQSSGFPAVSSSAAPLPSALPPPASVDPAVAVVNAMGAVLTAALRANSAPTDALVASATPLPTFAPFAGRGADVSAVAFDEWCYHLERLLRARVLAPDSFSLPPNLASLASPPSSFLPLSPRIVDVVLGAATKSAFVWLRLHASNFRDLLSLLRGMRTRFIRSESSSISSDRTALEHLKQSASESVDAYFDRLEDLRLRCGSHIHAEADLLRFFRQGLRADLAARAFAHGEPATLEDAYRDAARVYTLSLACTPAVGTPPTSNARTSLKQTKKHLTSMLTSLGAPPEVFAAVTALSASNPSAVATSLNPAAPPSSVPRLTAEARADCIARNLCFRCREPCSASHTSATCPRFQRTAPAAPGTGTSVSLRALSAANGRRALTAAAVVAPTPATPPALSAPAVENEEDNGHVVEDIDVSHDELQAFLVQYRASARASKN